MTEDTRLDGKAIVVTGAAAGLGRAYAMALAGAGAAVVVNDLDRAGLDDVVTAIEQAGGRAVAVAGSVADWDVSAAVVAGCVDAFGAIDGLVSNAAIHHVAAALDEDEARVRRIVEVNVLGSLFPALHAFRAMAGQSRGRILNVTSGAHVGLLGMTAYGSTKGAVASLTYNLALEAEPVGVQVNALAPVAQTAMSPGDARRDGVARPRPEQIAPVVVHLMSEAAGQMTGQIVRYDGSSLSLLQPPRFSDHRVSDDIDTAAGIARAFEAGLAGQIAHPGVQPG